MSENFNPLDDKNIQRLFLSELENKEYKTFDELNSVTGHGVYIIWSLELPYEFDKKSPVYIGKAVSSGGRKGNTNKFISSPLRKRLLEHMNSISKAVNLDITKFKFKTISLDEHWTVYAEQLFIKTLNPLWNKEYDGFGNHPVGSTRAEQKTSKWDLTHPGRLTASSSRAMLTQTVDACKSAEGE